MQPFTLRFFSRPALFVLFATSAPAQTTSIASLDSAGQQAAGASRLPSISGNGDFVAFHTTASLDPVNDPNALTDVYVRDRVNGITVLASNSAVPGQFTAGGAAAASLSKNGARVAFQAAQTSLVADIDTNSASDVFLRDLTVPGPVLVSRAFAGGAGNGESTSPALSGDGRFVAFISKATDLVAAPSAPANVRQIYRRDVEGGATDLVSVGLGGAAGDGDSTWCALSDDGRYVAFESSASNLVAGDTNGVRDVFVRDMLLPFAPVQRVSLRADGTQTVLDSNRPSISGDGARLAFYSADPEIVAGDVNALADVFRVDRASGAAILVSQSSSGVAANGPSFSSALSFDGSSIVFHSLASNLVAGSGDGDYDVFVRRSTTETTEAISVTALGLDVLGSTQFWWNGAVSSDGRHIAFESASPGLVDGDGNSDWDAFVRDLPATSATNVCAGDGVTSATACPCGNFGALGHGCGHSIDASGGELIAEGSPSVAQDTLALLARTLPPTANCLLFQGSGLVAAGAGAAFGDGILCATSGVIRLASRAAFAGVVRYGAGIGTDPLVSVRGLVPAGGATRYYQGWFRNPPAFCTASTFNLTNGIRVVWTP